MLATMLHPPAATITLSATPSHPLAGIYVDVSFAECATGTGTVASPVCSIGAAIALAAPGDTVRIAPGIYFESMTLGLDLIGTSGASVTNGLGQVGRGISLGGSLTRTNSTIDQDPAPSSSSGGVAALRS